MKALIKFLRKFEDVMVAATYAEEGEVRTARKILMEEEYREEKTTKKKIESSKPIILKPDYL